MYKQEFKDLIDSPMEGVSIQTKTEDDVTVWHAVVDGPVIILSDQYLQKDSPYEGGKFTVEIDFTDNYPFKSPKVKS